MEDISTGSKRSLPLANVARVNVQNQDFTIVLREIQSILLDEPSGGAYIKQAIEKVLVGESANAALVEWSCSQVPSSTRKRYQPTAHDDISGLSKKKLRQLQYHRIQRLWNKNMSKAARKVLDGESDTDLHPTLAQQDEYWRSILGKEDDHPVPTAPENGRNDARINIWYPVTIAEVLRTKLSPGTAPGPDGLTALKWQRVPPIIKVAIFNIILAQKDMPNPWKLSRTILIPKKAGAMDPSLYRPISISSVIFRHLHKLLANRISSSNLLDCRQRAFISADGAAENISILASVLSSARKELSHLHIVTLDVRKAFDTVNHSALIQLLSRRGLPDEFVTYGNLLYTSAETVLEVDGSQSRPIKIGRGVRQGDPLSPLLFNLVIDEVLKAVPDVVGRQLGESKMNVLAFADDLVLVTSTAEGMNMSLSRVLQVLSSYGLTLSPEKCSALSLIPSGKQKKLKVLEDPAFAIEGKSIPQLGVLDRWKYLGLDFSLKDPRSVMKDIKVYLARIKSAPLKPQQRLKVLTTFLLPRYIHSLVLGGTSYGMLRSLDKKVRAAVRLWLRLPYDVPVPFFHAAVRDGGLGIQSFVLRIPELKRRRLEALANSQWATARECRKGDYVESCIRWCRRSRDTSKDWARKLYSSVDGYELREASRYPASTSWLRDEHLLIPSRDWLQYIRTLINALLSRMRTIVLI